MQSEVRLTPSGLKALAVLSFVFGGWKLLGTLNMLACLSCAQGLGDKSMAYAYAGASLALAVLMIVMGVGLLGVRPALGRWLSVGYAAAAIAAEIVSLALDPSRRGTVDSGFLVNLVFPLEVLFFVNVVFADLWPGARRREPSAKPDNPWLLIGRYGLRQTLRSASGVLIFTLGVLAMLVAVQVVQGVLGNFGIKMSINGGQADFGSSMIQSYYAGLVGVFDPDPRFAQFLLSDQPGLLSLCALVLSFMLPYFVVAVGATQIAADNAARGLRFVLLRAGRRNLYRGKLLGTVALAALMAFLVAAMATAFAALQSPGDQTLANVLWGLRIFAMLLLSALPFCALAVALSGLIASSAGAVFAGLGLTFLPTLCLMLSGGVHALRVGEFLLPQKAGFLLLHPDPGMAALGFLALCAYTALFGLGGNLLFGKRNL